MDITTTTTPPLTLRGCILSIYPQKQCILFSMSIDERGKAMREGLLKPEHRMGNDWRFYFSPQLFPQVQRPEYQKGPIHLIFAHIHGQPEIVRVETLTPPQAHQSPVARLRARLGS